MEELETPTASLRDQDETRAAAAASVQTLWQARTKNKQKPAFDAEPSCENITFGFCKWKMNYFFLEYFISIINICRLKN